MRCREVTRLISESLDRDLPFGKRIGIYLHFIICRYCVRYRRHLRFIRRLIRMRRDMLAAAPAAPEAPTLSRDARERMKAALRSV